MNAYLLIALAYVIGATPTSYWLGRALYGVNLSEEGSGNLGATNTFRVLGWKAAAPVMVVDIAKAWFPTYYFPLVDNQPGWSWALAYGGAAIVGHVFSFWVGFRGGKGVAASAGVFLALSPHAVLAALLTWLLTLAGTRIVSVASMVAAITIPVWLWLRPQPGGSTLLAFTIAMALFVLWAHRSNIQRLIRGEEPRIRSAQSGNTG